MFVSRPLVKPVGRTTPALLSSFRCYASSPAGPSTPSPLPSLPKGPKEQEEVIPPLPRKKYHPKPGFTRLASRSNNTGKEGGSSTPKPPPFQFRPKDHPARTSRAELEELYPKPLPANWTTPDQGETASPGGFGSPSAVRQMTPSFSASPRSQPAPSSSSSSSSFTATPRPRASSPPPPPSTDEPSDSPSARSTPDPIQPILWSFFALVVLAYGYEKASSLGLLGEKGAAYVGDTDRRKEQAAHAEERRRLWLEEVRKERLAKQSSEATPATTLPKQDAGAGEKAETGSLPLEVEKVAPAVEKAVLEGDVKPLADGQDVAQSKTKRWGLF